MCSRHRVECTRLIRKLLEHKALLTNAAGLPDVRLKLTLAYDGTGFRGWAAQPGLRTVEGEVASGARRDVPELERPRRRRPHGRRRARARRTSRASTSRAARLPSARAEALNAALPDDVAVRRGRRGAARLPRALLGARRAATATASGARARRSPFERDRSWWQPRPLDLARLDAQAALLAGEHDFRAFTPTETQHETFTRVVESRALGRATATCSRSRSRPTPSCGTWCGRSSGRWSTASSSRRSSRAGRASDAGQTAPPSGLYLVGVAATIERVRFPVVLFDLDGTLVDSGAIILGSFHHATRDRAAAPSSRRADPRARSAARTSTSRCSSSTPDRVDELVRVYRDAQRAAARRARVLRRDRRRARRAEARGPPARRRLGEAQGDGAARLRRLPASACTSTSSSARTTRSATSPIPSPS